MAKRKNEGSRSLAPALADYPFDSDFGRLFDAPLRRWNWPSFSRFPSVDMADEGSRIRITADLPGIEKEKVRVHIARNTLSISADTHSNREEKGRNYYYRERSSSGYYRSIPLPTEVDEKSAKAKFSNGTLEIVLNKKNAGKREVTVE